MKNYIVNFQGKVDFHVCGENKQKALEKALIMAQMYDAQTIFGISLDKYEIKEKRLTKKQKKYLLL